MKRPFTEDDAQELWRRTQSDYHVPGMGNRAAARVHDVLCAALCFMSLTRTWRRRKGKRAEVERIMAQALTRLAGLGLGVSDFQGRLKEGKR